MCALMHGTSCNVLQQGALQIHIHSMVPLGLDCHSTFLSGVVRIFELTKVLSAGSTGCDHRL